MKPSADARRNLPSLGQQQQRQQRDEFRSALRALLMTPLMGAAHEDFAAVRRQADALRDWFARETGWVLHVEREGARLYKRPAELSDATRGLPGYDGRRYVLLCLACAVLERADAQITLRLLGERLLLLAAEPMLATRGFTFTLGAQSERRELVAVCRTLLALGVLQRVAGDEDGFVQAGAGQADALYDVQRRVLAGMLAAVRGPSTWTPEEAPASLDERLHALVDEHVADSDEARRTLLRHRLARRLLDDPVVYGATLDALTLAYFMNQRGSMATRLCEAAGLTPEQRAEGLALVDEAGELTDVAMPAEGTEAHATLLVAEYLAAGYRSAQQRPATTPEAVAALVREQDIVSLLREAKESHGRYWRKSAREPGAERELAALAIDRLARLQLVSREADGVRALPALARFALGKAEVSNVEAAQRASAAASASLFDPA
jgi:uncharacterized protein (TIGR02678 family)